MALRNIQSSKVVFQTSSLAQSKALAKSQKLYLVSNTRKKKDLQYRMVVCFKETVILIVLEVFVIQILLPPTSCTKHKSKKQHKAEWSWFFEEGRRNLLFEQNIGFKFRGCFMIFWYCFWAHKLPTLWMR